MTTTDTIRWETGADNGFSCQYPFRVALDPSRPRLLAAIDLSLNDTMLAVFYVNGSGLPVLQFTKPDYDQALSRLTELAAAQVEENKNRDYAAIVGGLMRNP